MNMSTIDQRPTPSMIRYIRRAVAQPPVERRCTEISRKTSPISFSTGTVMLAKNTRSAIGHMPACDQLASRRSMIVSGSPWPNEITVITGSRLAGM